MKTNIIQWDESMVVRCLARCSDDYTQTAYLPRGVNSYKVGQVKTTPEKAPLVKATPEEALSFDITAGEWDDFQYALNSMLKKKHK